MKKILLMAVAVCCIVPAAYGSDKMTSIKGILMICTEGSADRCPEKIFDPFIMASPIKFLTRKHLDLVLREQQLQMSGLTDREKTVRMGRLLGASHILLYGKEGEEPYGNRAVLLHLQLINVETSEIEYSATLRWHGNEGGGRYLDAFFQELKAHQDK